MSRVALGVAAQTTQAVPARRPDEQDHPQMHIRGTARVETVTGVVPEYTQAVECYYGADQGRAW